MTSAHTWIAAVDCPQDIEDEAAMTFFGGEEGDTCCKRKAKMS
jgi:hypothetical protein